jgi:hypothetical protein
MRRSVDLPNGIAPGSDPPPTGVDSSGIAIRVVFFLVIAGLSVVLIWKVFPGVLAGKLIDPDNYMRLVRVNRLFETGAWFDSSIPRSNAPFGEVLHWTRPFDVLLLVGSAILLPFFSFSEALFWSGVFVSPLLLLLIGYSAVWASAPLSGRRFRFLAMITLLAQVGVLQSTLPGRPDHHSLHILIFVLTVGMAIRWLMKPFSRQISGLTGGLVGAGLWVGPEFLVPLALLLACGLFLWIRKGKDLAGKNLWFSLGLVGVLLLALLLEHRPSDLLSVEYDRISILHVVIAGSAVLFWGGISKLPGHRAGLHHVKGRIIWTLLAGPLALGVLVALFPSFLSGPEAGIHPRLMPLWRTYVVEDQPLVSSMGMSEWGDFLFYLGPVVFCLPFLAWILFKEWDKPTGDVWVLLGIFLLTFTGLALFRIRFVPYPEVVFIIVSVTLISRILPLLHGIRNALLGTLLRSGVAFGIICGPLLLGAALMGAGEPAGQESAAALASDCPITDMAVVLADLDAFGGAPQVIATHMGYGPEILYRTHHRVIGTPYHRNADGILSLFSILAATDLTEARRLVEERGVGLILVCPHHSWIYSASEEGTSGDASFHNQLVAGQVPDWLETVNLTGEIPGGFLLFRTKDRLGGR